MKTRFSTLWDDLHSSLWFVPSLMVLAAIGLSFLTVSIDRHVAVKWVRTVGWIWAGGADGARSVLSTIAGSVITVAGVTFSITITALVLASSQFGPRLLRNFMRDTGNQLVLGTFISTFLYCLLVLRTVRSVDESSFVPYISVSVGLVLAIISVGVLIYFIHHMADSIQANNLASAVAKELHESIDRLFPQKLGQDACASSEASDEMPPDFDDQACSVEASRSGYLQSIDNESLMQLACDHDVVIRLHRRPGDFVAAGNDLAMVWPPQHCNPEFIQSLGKVFFMGRHRTTTQDAQFSVNQLEEIAVRALSPGINDPFTALTCIDWLGASLGRLAECEMPAPQRRDKKGALRVVVAAPLEFGLFCDAAFHQIRQYGASSVEVMLHLLKTIAEIAKHIKRPADYDSLRQHADLVAADGCAQTANLHDRQRIQESHQATLQALVQKSRDD